MQLSAAMTRILLIGLKEGSQVVMVYTRVVIAATSLALLSKKHEPAFVFGEELCDAGVVTAHGKAGVLDVPGGLHVAGNIGSSSLEELHVVPQLKR